jgi:DNA-directed RNA polymerase subunit beta
MAVDREAGSSIATHKVAETQHVLSNIGVGRKTYARIPAVLEMPNLVQVQLESFSWFKEEGLRELLEEISPISDHHKKMDLYLFDPEFREPWQRMPKGEEQDRAMADPRIAEVYCRERDITYAAPLYVHARLVINETGEIRETAKDNPIFIGDFR